MSAKLSSLPITSATHEAPRYHVYHLSAAFKPRPAKEWVVDDLISAGSVNLLVGEPGSCKTWSMLHLAVSVGLGLPWLGFGTARGTALIIDEESGSERLLDRLYRVACGMGADADASVVCTSLAGFNLLHDADEAALNALVVDTEPRLVIIDALADVMLGGDENAVKDVQPVFTRLRRLADRHRAAVVVIHHLNKSGDYRGSSAMLGAVDLMLSIEKREGKPLSFQTEKNRDGEKISFAAHPRFDEGAFQLVAAANLPRGARLSESEERVLIYLHEHGDSPTSDIKANTKGIEPEAARQALYAVERKGFVRRMNNGGRGSEAIYGLTTEGRAVVDVL